MSFVIFGIVNLWYISRQVSYKSDFFSLFPVKYISFYCYFQIVYEKRPKDVKAGLQDMNATNIPFTIMYLTGMMLMFLFHECQTFVNEILEYSPGTDAHVY